MTRRGWISSLILFLMLTGTGTGLAMWKLSAWRAAEAASASEPEPVESVTVAEARALDHKPTTTAIGTVLALRSITLRNELAGTVKDVKLTSGQIVEAGAVLVALDVSVEEAELKALEAQAALAEAMLARHERLRGQNATTEVAVDQARAERDVALAQIARIKAVVAKKVIRAPFRARIGLADVHPGQYLNEGTELTTLQGADDAAHVDFAVAQRVAAGLRPGQRVDIFATSGAGNDVTTIPASIVAVDARVDSATRNAMVRARIQRGAGGAGMPAPGASVRVSVPAGPARAAVAVPVTALRKGPEGDHVFVIARDKDGKMRAHARRVESGAASGEEVLIHAGLEAREQVVASGSFKLREAAAVTIAAAADRGRSEAAATASPE
jgi:membrane fusion protein (multidrug efflux system)